MKVIDSAKVTASAIQTGRQTRGDGADDAFRFERRHQDAADHIGKRQQNDQARSIPLRCKRQRSPPVCVCAVRTSPCICASIAMKLVTICAITDAANAAQASEEKRVQDGAKAAGPGQLVPCSGLSSGDADAWVQEHVADVGYELCDQNDEDGHDRTGQQQFDVIVAGRLHQRPAEAFVVEQRLDDHDAVQQPRELQHDDGEGGDQRVSERVFHDDVAEADALEACGADVLRRHDFGHRGAGHAGDIAHAVKRDGQDRQEEVPEVSVVCGTGCRALEDFPASRRGEKRDEDHARDVFRCRRRGDGEGRERPVEFAILRACRPERR